MVGRSEPILYIDRQSERDGFVVLLLLIFSCVANDYACVVLGVRVWRVRVERVWSVWRV